MNFLLDFLCVLLVESYDLLDFAIKSDCSSTLTVQHTSGQALPVRLATGTLKVVLLAMAIVDILCRGSCIYSLLQASVVYVMRGPPCNRVVPKAGLQIIHSDARRR